MGTFRRPLSRALVFSSWPAAGHNWFPTVADLPIVLHIKLLRVLEDTSPRLGGSRDGRQSRRARACRHESDSHPCLRDKTAAARTCTIGPKSRTKCGAIERDVVDLRSRLAQRYSSRRRSGDSTGHRAAGFSNGLVGTSDFVAARHAPSKLDSRGCRPAAGLGCLRARRISFC